MNLCFQNVWRKSCSTLMHCKRFHGRFHSLVWQASWFLLFEVGSFVTYIMSWRLLKIVDTVHDQLHFTLPYVTLRRTVVAALHIQLIWALNYHFWFNFLAELGLDLANFCFIVCYALNIFAIQKSQNTVEKFLHNRWMYNFRRFLLMWNNACVDELQVRVPGCINAVEWCDIMLMSTGAKCEFQDALVLFSEKKISSVQSIIPLSDTSSERWY